MNWQLLLNLRKFWVFVQKSHSWILTQNPALWCALSITLGLFTKLETIASLIPFVVLITFLNFKEKIISLLLFLTAVIVAHNFYAIPSDQETAYQETIGISTFTISSCEPAKYGGFLYKGHIQTNLSKKTIHLPCRTFSKIFYDTDYEYLIEGMIKKKPDRSFVTIKTDKPWVPTKKIQNFIKPRAQMKKKVIQFLKSHLKEPSVSAFLSTLVTGETQDEIQRHVFAKLGLAHLFAISGFHFALFSFAFHFFLRLFLPKKAEAICLLAVISLFFLFLGNSPSVARAWFMAAFAMIAILVEKEKQSLNTFGLALLFVILMDPYIIKDLSFQLSFLATVGILLFYHPFDTLLQYLFPKYAPDQILQKSLKKQYLYIFSAWFRKAMALNFAVHLVLFPMQLSVFSKFPWHSLNYNLFFPFLVSIALFLLLGAIGLYCLGLGETGFIITNWYTKTILYLTEYPPFPQKTTYVEHLFEGFTPLMLTLIFFLGILWRFYLEKKRHYENLDFIF